MADMSLDELLEAVEELDEARKPSSESMSDEKKRLAREYHCSLQRDVFDESSTFYSAPLPEEVPAINAWH